MQFWFKIFAQHMYLLRVLSHKYFNEDPNNFQILEKKWLNMKDKKIKSLHIEKMSWYETEIE